MASRRLYNAFKKYGIISQGNSVSQVKEAIHNRRVALLNAIHEASFKLSSSCIALLSRLTTLQSYRKPFVKKPYGELFIHWFYVDRHIDKLSACEIFHLNMLQYFNVMDSVEVIHVRCAYNGNVTEAMKYAQGILSSGKATLDFKIVPKNNRWEHDTFMECTEYAISTGKFVYYTHFKGVTRLVDSNLNAPIRHSPGNSPLDIMYWCYLMYMALFEAPDGVKAIGPLLHFGCNAHYRNRDIGWSQLCKGSPVFHYCGSFQAFSGAYILECLQACNLGDSESRLKKLWIGDPYAVEMFLSMVSLRKDVYSLDVPYEATNGIYKVYSKHSIPAYEPGFNSLYSKQCTAF